VGKAVFWFQVSFGQYSNITEADSCVVTGEFRYMFSPYVV